MFALIANGSVAQVSSAEFPVHPSLVWVDVSAVSPAPQAGWLATQTNGIWTFAVPPVLLLPLPSLALQALAASDTAMHRIAEAVSLGLNSWTGTDVVAWTNYRRELRAISDGSDLTATALPAKPAYPAGT